MRTTMNSGEGIHAKSTEGQRRAFWSALLLGIALVISGRPLEAAVLVVTPAAGETMPADLAEQAQTVAGVTKLERYLLVRTQPHDVIGIDAEAPLRIITSDGKVIEARVEVGKAFRKVDEGKNVALVGNGVYAKDYDYQAGAMATMKHVLQVGQTFTLIEAGPRIRVLGTFAVSPDAEAAKVFLPLTTAQKLFGQEGKLSHLFLTVEEEPERAAKAVEAALGGSAKVTVVSP